MTACLSCGHENQPGARFCSACGAAIAAVGGVARREERKVVSVLFADLVGFTSRSEQLDPEDVRALLSPYYTRLRAELERFGGTVEKFIGDAVMAVFGAPVAHEDDAERAVRAALVIRDWVVGRGAGLQLRIAVNTGEALVALDAQPAHGEGMVSGDVVNTAARLEAAAPVNGVLVGETTYRATSSVVRYRPAEPVVAKGKSEPVAAWEALEATSRLGSDLDSVTRSPLVGRLHELGVLTDGLARVRRERTPQLVTIIGVPGIGKSRLVAELGRAIDEDPEHVVLWRQGRSLPYGDGVTFWALAEMVKAQAGILETDTPDQAGAKLQACVGDLVPERADADWIFGHLRALAGVGISAGGVDDRREEAFNAWRRFFEALAESHPLALVFEDLHWADDNLLDFIEHLVDWVSGVPMLIVCTARPELHERRPGWAGGKRHAITLSLSSLSDEETAQLISALSDRPVMAAATQEALLSRAGGNPLYAEQYVRMTRERPGSSDLPMPETVQGIIAARLDALPPVDKSLLQVAAVMGKLFWLGAVAHMADSDRHTTELRLHALERKDFLQRARRSSVAGEAEYSFLHVLVRDVAYGEIPRRQRAEQHRRAAEWIAGLGRPEDHAEMLAHHYLSALELQRLVGEPVDASVVARAVASLSAAGDRAISLSAYPAAAGFYQAALDLAPADSLDHARLLLQLGRTRYATGDVGIELLEAACRELVAHGDVEAAAEAETALSGLLWTRGDRDSANAHLQNARQLVDDRAPSRVKGQVISTVSRTLMLAGDHEGAIRLAREALVIAEQLHLDRLRAHALQNIGGARVESGDPGGVTELEESVAIALAADDPAEACKAKGNLAATLLDLGRLQQALALYEEADEMAAHFGLAGDRRWYRAELVLTQFMLGRWPEALAGADEFLGEVESGSPHYLAPGCYFARAEIRLGRDETAGALADVERAMDLARLAKDPQILYPTAAHCAHVLREAGDVEHAAALAGECLTDLKSRVSVPFLTSLHVLAWTMTALGRGRELAAALPTTDVPAVRAAAAVTAGDLGAAADICADTGALAEEARDRLWLAEALVAQQRRAEADVQLHRALRFHRSVGALRYVREGEQLLAATA